MSAPGTALKDNDDAFRSNEALLICKIGPLVENILDSDRTAYDPAGRTHKIYIIYIGEGDENCEYVKET